MVRRPFQSEEVGMRNKTIALLLAITPAVLAGAVQAQNVEDLKNDHRTSSNVLTYGMGYNNQRYSALKSINKKSVANLVPVWNYSLNNAQGQEAQPIIHDGMMFVTTHTSTVALDPITGRQLWKHELEFAADVFKMACCGLVNRGAAIYNGKVYRTTLDSHLVALDAKTGKQVWKQRVI